MKSDARVRYTKAVIKDCFLQLMNKKPVDRITVTELCAMAEINRATFYAHYDDCYDLLRSIENEFLDQFKCTGKTQNWCGARDLISSIYDTVAENMDICDVLIFHSENPSLLTRMIALAREQCMSRWHQTMTSINEQQQEMLFVHLATGLASVIFTYFKTCEREQLIDFMVEITMNCLAPYRSV